ncbi:hypothetical protein ACFSCV_08705 [Methylopila henanensis]|uniref:Uncharacterized protein n=1 Tax=Methylopila henanensis TaxID=873516 RepID=A0ABW4K6P1_9HYPH
MLYTVIFEGDNDPSATVVDGALNALNLAQHEARSKRCEVTIATENGWYMSLDELEELVRQ